MTRTRVDHAEFERDGATPSWNIPTMAEVIAMSMAVEEPKRVTVYWYDHDCEWISKYCDEHHRRVSHVPVTSLEDVAVELGVEST